MFPLFQVIYYTKLLMFSTQLELTLSLVTKLRRVVQFIALLYVPAWLAAPVTADAPVNDLTLYQRLLRYKAVDKEIAGAALKALRRHLWYLRPQTVMFALCSDKVGARVKEEMALKLKTLAVPESFPIVNVSVDEETCLPDLVDEQSWHVFATLQQCHAAWLSMPASAWDDDPQFCLWKDTVTNMQVTNDVAERGVKLVQDFANSVTKSEPQLQNLLQLVEKHRRDVPDFKKSSLSQM